MPMFVARSLEEWRAHFERAGSALPRAALAIGNFDGVHRGHQEILRSVLRHARKSGSIAAVVTFDPHPLAVLRPEQAPKMLMTLDERLAAFEQIGLDACLVLRFDEAFSQIPADAFVREILSNVLRAQTILVGATFRFGHKHSGDVELLKNLGRMLDFGVVTVAPVMFRGAIISSTAIRNAIGDGRISDSGRLLGRPFVLNGSIRRGAGIGAKLVVPTINLATPAEILPKNGVYVTETKVGPWWYRSVTNVGVRPTFEGEGVSVESFLFDFSPAAVEGSMSVRFWTRLRDERKFPGPEELRDQIQRDASCAQQFFRLLAARRRRANSLPV